MADLDELREKAKNADGGHSAMRRWRYTRGRRYDRVITYHPDDREPHNVAETGLKGTIEKGRAEYIAAADPETVLALIDRIERYEDAMERMARATGNPAVERIRKEAMEDEPDE